ncbi:hypothetical protein QN377_08710 [Pseudomonas sp. CCC4.1]|uniref:hypothetical protein n=1 Tax=Pseudomonas TaxID=286 RepID=UPI001EEED0AC|nr:MULTISPECIES: hypothetical protein [Pseudomonas]MDY7572660.1 hypothetical protein [Pseudomonas sp. CCC4.1]MEB0143206.1 hypothetical protein [Pseudomonas sp. CCC4.1]
MSVKDIANLASVSLATAKASREAFDFKPAAPLPETPERASIQNYQGPWLGYESLFGSISAAKISRAVGVPISIVEQRQAFLGVTPYQRLSRVDRYEHLVGVVPNNVLAKLAGVSPARIADIRKRKYSKREPS